MISKILKLPALVGAMALAMAIAFAGPSPAQAQDKDPIRIGFGLALTGGLAGAGKSALIAMQIWEKDINDAGGLLGRPVELVYYDDQTNPATVPGIYTKLLDVDKVDLIVSGYGTNLIAPLMPIAVQRNLLLPSLFGLGNNEDYKYDRYFSMQPAGGEKPRQGFSIGFFELAKAMGAKTVAVAAADAEFAQNAAQGAKLNAKDFGLEIVYDQSYPPATADFTPIVRAINAANPDVVFVGAYPPDGAGMVRAVNEVGLNEKTKMFGGGLVGMQYATLMENLGPMLTGIVNYDFFVPAPTLQFEGFDEFLEKYRPRAKEAGVDPLGYYLPPYAYALLQGLGQAVEGAGSLDHAALTEYYRNNSFDTIVGPIKYGSNGEWEKARVFMIQFHDVKPNNVEQFTDPKTRPILTPKEYATGEWASFHDLRK